jgi:hypothetical protein
MVNQRIAKIAKHAIEFRERVHPAPISVRRGNKALKISSLVAPCPTPCPVESGNIGPTNGNVRPTIGNARWPTGNVRPPRRVKIVKIFIERALSARLVRRSWRGAGTSAGGNAPALAGLSDRLSYLRKQPLTTGVI